MLSMQCSDSNPLCIRFIGKSSLLVVQKGDSTMIVTRQTLGHIEQLPISSQRPAHDAINGLDTPAYTASEIILDPAAKTGLFMDYHQRKYWIILKGKAKLTVGNSANVVSSHYAKLIPAMTEHRIENVGEQALVFVEFRTREYLSGHEVIEFSQHPTLTRLAV